MPAVGTTTLAELEVALRGHRPLLSLGEIHALFLGGVVDTLTLTTHPVVTGEGRRLFDDTTDLTRLTLVDSAITSAGNAVLTYSLRP